MSLKSWQCSANFNSAVMLPAIIMKYFRAIFDPRTRRLYIAVNNHELDRIADFMYEWEGSIAEELDLTRAEVEGIKTEFPQEPK